MPGESHQIEIFVFCTFNDLHDLLFDQNRNNTNNQLKNHNRSTPFSMEEQSLIKRSSDIIQSMKAEACLYAPLEGSGVTEWIRYYNAVQHTLQWILHFYSERYDNVDHMLDDFTLYIQYPELFIEEDNEIDLVCGQVQCFVRRVINEMGDIIEYAEKEKKVLPHYKDGIRF